MFEELKAPFQHYEVPRTKKEITKFTIVVVQKLEKVKEIMLNLAGT